MPVPNPVMPVKGAGTTLWVYKGSGDPYANPLSDVDWSRLAKVKDLTPGELTAESYDDSYLDDEDADWTATGQGQKSAGDTSFTLAWMPGEQGQQALLSRFSLKAAHCAPGICPAIGSIGSTSPRKRGWARGCVRPPPPAAGTQGEYRWRIAGPRRSPPGR